MSIVAAAARGHGGSRCCLLSPTALNFVFAGSKRARTIDPTRARRWRRASPCASSGSGRSSTSPTTSARLTSAHGLSGELAWGHIKTRIAKASVQTKDELKAMVDRVMRPLPRMPEIVARLFHAPACDYAKM